MDQENLSDFFYDVQCAVVCISPLGVQFIQMVANGSEKAFCVLTFHECQSFTIVQRQFRTKFGKQPPLPASIPELKVGIRTTTETITADMLQTVWNELDYRVDVCRIAKSAHVEHLKGM